MLSVLSAMVVVFTHPQEDSTVTSTRRCILGVFAHPDDETSCAGGTFCRYAREGVDIYIATATRGEQGTLGTHGQVVTREDLPRVREAELRTVLQMYGANPPIFLGYRDQEMSQANFGELVARVAAVMTATMPDVVITFGPMGLSGHPDHVVVHRATVAAFHQYRQATIAAPRLYYKALLAAASKALGLTLTGPEVQPTVAIDISALKALKVRALRTYTTQEDAQRLAMLFEQLPWAVEAFHQAYPPLSAGRVTTGFWEVSDSATQ
jgi:LmbE family N-acetylglucosaminyl deacetylase